MSKKFITEESFEGYVDTGNKFMRLDEFIKYHIPTGTIVCGARYYFNKDRIINGVVQICGRLRRGELYKGFRRNCTYYKNKVIFDIIFVSIKQQIILNIVQDDIEKYIIQKFLY
jgi:hypothetical protein